MTRASSYSSMPGAFAPHENAGPKSHLFQPPRTPSASSSLYLARSNASILSEPFERPTIIGKKRSRHDYSVESNATPASIMGDWSNGMETSDSMARSESMDPGSPVPFVNTRYRLAGGLDTPTATAAAAHDVGRSEYAEVGYRKTLSDLTEGSLTTQEVDSYFPEPPEYQFTDANGRARTQTYEPQKAGWSRLAIEAVGGVVGKVWEFCKAGAFRGFAAGGGQPYNVENVVPSTPVESGFRMNESQKGPSIDYLGDRESTPIPGQYIESPEDDYISNYMDRRELESTPPRPSKRLQISNEDGDLARNWIMVSANNMPSIDSPTNMNKRTARYSMPTASSAGRNFVRTPSSRPASRASGRRPILPTRASVVSHAGSPGLNPSRPASFASPRSPGGTRISSSMNHHPNKKTSIQHGHISTSSPVSIEAQKFTARRRKEDKEADESIRRFNAQLQAMIREGKEALGTKVEVEDELVMEYLSDDDFE